MTRAGRMPINYPPKRWRLWIPIRCRPSKWENPLRQSKLREPNLCLCEGPSCFQHFLMNPTSMEQLKFFGGACVFYFSIFTVSFHLISSPTRALILMIKTQSLDSGPTSPCWHLSSNYSFFCYSTSHHIVNIFINHSLNMPLAECEARILDFWRIDDA